MWDLIVIGGGSAGLTAATIGGRVGASVLLVDKTALGGDCLHSGCVPSKALIRCARAAHEARSARRFGVRVGEPQIVFEDVMVHVRGAIAHIGEHDSPKALESVGVQVAFGGAELVAGLASEAAVRIGGERVEEARRIIICVGSRSAPPPIDGLDEVGFIDHVGVFQLSRLPARLAVIGGGPIGIELGQAFARLGSRVTILERADGILPRDDRELADRLLARLKDEVEVRLGVLTTRVERNVAAACKTVIYEQSGVEHRVDCDEILVAAGRRASLTGLGLEAGGVETDRGRIVVDRFLRTTAPSVYAAGDCVGPFQFTHFAEAQARVAARNALFRGRKAMKARPNVPWVTFCDPELAQVGLTEAQARETHPDARVYRYPFDRLDRAVCEGSTDGLAKLVATPKGRILGASILGHGAGEAIANVVLAMDAKRSLSDIGSGIFAYPTMSRIVRRLADEPFLSTGVSPAVARWFGRFHGRSQ